MPRKVEAYKDPVTGQVFATAKEASAAENKFNKRKYATLTRRIARKKYWVPKVGDYIYTMTRCSISHGEDDVVGGLSTVAKVYLGMSGGNPKCVFVEISQHERGSNWTQFCYPEQKKLMGSFGTEFAYPDPDYTDYGPDRW